MVASSIPKPLPGRLLCQAIFEPRMVSEFAKPPIYCIHAHFRPAMVSGLKCACGWASPAKGLNTECDNRLLEQGGDGDGISLA